MRRHYAGIGSRKTPPEILVKMRRIGRFLAEQGWTLRSGKAKGADEAFEEGADEAFETEPDALNRFRYKEIFPDSFFSRKPFPPGLIDLRNECRSIAQRIHPAWDRMTEWMRNTHARNILQIMGEDMCSPVELVCCWTPEGKDVGGTRTAIVCARDWCRDGKVRKIRIVNLAIGPFPYADYLGEE